MLPAAVAEIHKFPINGMIASWTVIVFWSVRINEKLGHRHWAPETEKVKEYTPEQMRRYKRNFTTRIWLAVAWMIDLLLRITCVVGLREQVIKFTMITFRHFQQPVLRWILFASLVALNGTRFTGKPLGNLLLRHASLDPCLLKRVVRMPAACSDWNIVFFSWEVHPPLKNVSFRTFYCKGGAFRVTRHPCRVTKKVEW